MRDEIFITGLELHARIGVSDAERANPQRLELDITVEPLAWFSAMNDSIESTVNYQTVANRLQEWIVDKDFKLIETLGEEVAGVILHEFPVLRVRLEIRKFILPQTRCVGVRLERSQ